LGYNIGPFRKAGIKTKLREKAIENVTKLIENEEYHCRAKNGFQGVLSRNRKLNYKILIVLLIKGMKSSLQRSLDSFYKEVTGSDYNIREVTKGAFTQARAKLKHEAFIELNDNVNKTFYDEAPYLVWHGLRLLSVDGTTLFLPDHKSVRDEFSTHGFGPNADSKRSLATASLLYDSLNLMTIDAQIAPYAASERELLYRHLDKVKPGDLLLLDRGYPSLALFFLLRARGVDFCIRMKEDWWLKVKSFSKSKKKDMIVTFELPVKDRHLLADYPEMAEKPITCRLIKIKLPNGGQEILCTSLIEKEKYLYEDFPELYHYRWNEEEGYKLFKSRVEVENFTGKTALAVKQDFFAKVFMMSLCAVLSFPIEEKVRKEYNEEKNKYAQKINRTTALAMTSNISIGLLLKKTVDKAIDAFDKIVGKTREVIRPGRTHDRIKRPKKYYYMNYKPL
jgi:hypothetical protein